MPFRAPQAWLNRAILKAIFLCIGACTAFGSGCSSGEVGLVLGRPLPGVQAGGSGGGAGTAAVGGNEPGTAAAGSSGDEAGAGNGGAPDTLPGDLPWIAERCTPALEFSNHDTSAQGQLFNDAVPNPAKLVWAAAHAACRQLFRAADEVKDVPSITLIVEDAGGIASTGGTTIRLSTPYLKQQSDAGVDLTREIAGILHFATSLVYQNGGSSADPAPPRWLIVGIADFVRLESGYIDRATRAPGGNYDSGSQTTAFFLDYLTTKDPDIVYRLNRELAASSPAWTNDVFKSLLGSDLDTLWTEYQSTL